jgi:hypothetical protein
MDMLDAYILSVGGFLGVGQRYVAVKPDAVAITYDPAKGKWMASINATKEQLKEAPEFKSEVHLKQSTRNDTGWRARIRCRAEGVTNPA